MKKTFNKTLKMIQINWDTLILFQIFYNVLFLILKSFYNKSLSIVMRDVGIDYVSFENIFYLLSKPLIVLMGFVFILLLGVYIYIELVAIIHYCRYSAKGIRITFMELYHELLQEVIKLPKRIPLVIWFFFLIGLSSLPLNSVFVSGLDIPEFIMRYIEDNVYLFSGYLLFLMGLFILFIYWLFVPHIMILEDRSFSDSVKKSCQLVKRSFFSTLIGIVLWNGLLNIFLYLSYIAVLLIIIFMSNNGFVVREFWVWFNNLNNLYGLIKGILIVGGNFCFITCLYYQRIGNVISYQKVHRSFGRLFIRLTTITFILYVSIDLFNPYIDSNYPNSKLIIAHRGGGDFAVENTIAAIKVGIDSPADYLEIDVQETKDGEIVLYHDASLNRLTGINKKVSEMSLRELKKISIGNLEDEVIATLDEVLELVKGKKKLMIELKENSKNSTLVIMVLEKIKQYDMMNDCIIAASYIETIDYVKILSKEVDTAYITAISFGDISVIEEDIDYLALEATYINSSIINSIHDGLKKVLVWTVNDQRNLRKLIRMPIDGVITDNPYLAKYILENRGIDFFTDLLISGLLKNDQ